MPSELLGNQQTILEIAQRVFAEHLKQNVRYVELSFHAGIIEFLNMPGTEIISAIRSAVPRGLEVRIFMGMSRIPILIILELFSRMQLKIGMVCTELIFMDRRIYLPRNGHKAVGKARLNGRVLKAHAGEFGPAENVRWAVEELGAKKNSALEFMDLRMMSS